MTDLKDSKWQPIATAPRDGTNILILTETGIVEARFVPGEWSEHHEYGRQYDGPVWVCYDDAFQIEVEEIADENGKIEFYDHPVTHWQPLLLPPEVSK